MNSHPIQPCIALRGPVEIVNRGVSGPDRSKSAHANAIYGAVLTLSTLQPAALLNRRATTLQWQGARPASDQSRLPMASASRSLRSRRLASGRSPRRLGRCPFLSPAARSPGVLRDGRRRGTRRGGIQGSAAGADSTSSAGGLQNLRRRFACRGGTLDPRTYDPVALDLDHDAHAFTSFMKGRQIFPRM